MKIHRLEKMTKGWFVGNFNPSLYKTKEVEVAVKNYSAGDYEPAHIHKIATEVTVVIKGVVEMNGKRYTEGDIIVTEPNEATDFRVIEDAITNVVKIPGANDDKYPVAFIEPSEDSDTGDDGDEDDKSDEMR